MRKICIFHSSHWMRSSNVKFTLLTRQDCPVSSGLPCEPSFSLRLNSHCPRQHNVTGPSANMRNMFSFCQQQQSRVVVNSIHTVLSRRWCELDLSDFLSRTSRVINRWNLLDQEVVDAPSINFFKAKLTKVRRSRMGFFMD